MAFKLIFDILAPHQLFEGRGFPTITFSDGPSSLYPLIQNFRMSHNPLPKMKKDGGGGNNFKEDGQSRLRLGQGQAAQQQLPVQFRLCTNV